MKAGTRVGKRGNGQLDGRATALLFFQSSNIIHLILLWGEGRLIFKTFVCVCALAYEHGYSCAIGQRERLDSEVGGPSMWGSFLSEGRTNLWSQAWQEARLLAELAYWPFVSILSKIICQDWS